MSDEPKGRWQEVEPWPEPVDGRLLLNELAQALRRVVILPKWGAEILALWIVHTYAFLAEAAVRYEAGSSLCLSFLSLAIDSGVSGG